MDPPETKEEESGWGGDWDDDGWDKQKNSGDCYFH